MPYSRTPVYIPTDAASISMGSTNAVVDGCINNTTQESVITPCFDPSNKSSNVTLTDNNLRFQIGGGNDGVKGNFGLSSGKWYFECHVEGDGPVVGMCTFDSTNTTANGAFETGCTYSSFDGKTRLNGATAAAYGNALAAQDVMGIAVDLDNYAIYFAKNNTYQNSGNPTSGASKTGARALTSGKTYTWCAARDTGNDIGNLRFDSGTWKYDAPTGYSAITQTNTGIGNAMTLNPLTKASGGATTATISEGNTRWARANDGSNNQQCYGTFGATSGKFYFEFKLISASNGFDVGLFAEGEVNGNEGAGIGDGSSGSGYDVEGYYLENYGTGTHAWKVTKTRIAAGASAGVRQDTNDTAQVNDVCKVAVDFDAGKIWLGSVTHDTYYSGSDGSDVAFNTSAPTFTFTAGTKLFPYIFAHAQANDCKFFFNQEKWTGSAPTDFKAWNTANIPALTITDPSAHFQTQIWEGNGSSRTITFNGLSDMQPDLIWIKDRDETDSHALFDIVRGAQKYIQVNAHSTEQTSALGVTSFTSPSNGFTIGGDLNAINSSGDSIVAWCWKAGGSPSTVTDGMTQISDTSVNSNISRSVNTTAKCSIFTYTGTGNASKIQHGLGVTPDMFWIKCRDTTQGFHVWHKDLDTTNQGYIILNSSQKYETFGDLRIWGSNSLPDATHVMVGTHAGTNNSGDDFVGYAFAGVEGFSKFDIYEGTGTTDNAFINLGFRPSLFICKNMDSGVDGTSSATNWLIFDSIRNPDNRALTNFLQANETAVESQFNVDFVANGVKIRADNQSVGASNTYIYMAWAERPYNLNTRPNPVKIDFS